MRIARQPAPDGEQTLQIEDYALNSAALKVMRSPFGDGSVTRIGARSVSCTTLGGRSEHGL